MSDGVAICSIADCENGTCCDVTNCACDGTCQCPKCGVRCGCSTTESCACGVSCTDYTNCKCAVGTCTCRPTKS
ncbi:metallothionein-like [Argopecten irradians]|uniref:metallothionein-like n=1 Tax=Argopecten irradians TaxID=31199 RepID=UPI003723C4AB